jgi:DNA mismatch endonuclease, patch repair protein
MVRFAVYQSVNRTRNSGLTDPLPAVSARMRRTRGRDTPAELALRSALHRRGMRFYVDRAPLPRFPRRRADIVFPRVHVAVFLDGCFWHGCPEHATWPKANAEWWRAKIEANRSRDAATNAELEAAGWAVVRVWEHSDPELAADEVAARVCERRKS